MFFLPKKFFKDIKLLIFDFDGVFTDNFVYTSEDGRESIRSYRSDGIGIQKVKSLGIKVYIVSTETNKIVAVRAKKLSVECFYGIQDKSIIINDLMLKNRITNKNTAFVGNDINDIDALKLVGFPIAVSDSYHSIMKYAKYVTKKPGGYGAVREICDLIYDSHST